MVGVTSRRNLSGAQFGALASAYNEDGGSYHMPDLVQGKLVTASDRHPEGGYMVADPGTEHAPKQPVTEAQVAAHFQEHGRNEAEAYAGGWANNGHVYLDRSRWFPPTGGGLQQAKQAGNASGQIGAYALGGTHPDLPEWGGDVRLNMGDYGRNDVDPNFRPSPDPAVLGRNEISHPQGEKVAGRRTKVVYHDDYQTESDGWNRDARRPEVVESGAPHTYNQVLDTINENRAYRVRADKGIK